MLPNVAPSNQSVNGYNREFDLSGIFRNVLLIVVGGGEHFERGNLMSRAYFEMYESILLIVGGGGHMTTQDPSRSALGHQMLPLATSQLIGDNKEFGVKGIF